MLIKDHAENISNSPYFCPSVPLKRSSYSLCKQRDTWSLWKTLKCLPEVLKVRVTGIRAFLSWLVGTFYMVQAIEKATAPFALQLFFPCHFMVLFCFPWEYLAIFLFFSPLEPSGFALRVTAPLIVLAVSKMVCCLLSVGSLLLNAASGTPEHLDQSIGLSWPYFPHCPHPGDVCDNWREHRSPRVSGYRVRIHTPAAPAVEVCVFWGQKGTYGQGWRLPWQCQRLPGRALCALSEDGSGVLEESVINSSPFAGNFLLSVGTGCCETA